MSYCQFVSKEFKELISPIPCVGINRSKIFGSALKNKTKNRYPDVLPYEENRVVLSSSENDYINASLIPGKNGNYISCQAPLPHTFADFWLMIWEYVVPVVVMLTKFLEKRRVKAHCYWPGNVGDCVSFNDISVQLLEVCEDNNVVVRKFQLSRNEETRTVVHIHYTEWPDFGIPKTSDQFISVLSLIEEHRYNIDKEPHNIVVHCSAGIGRAGTLIAIHNYCEIKKMELDVKIKDMVDDMRKCRMGMVQTKEQYTFIYKVIEDLGYFSNEEQDFFMNGPRPSLSNTCLNIPTFDFPSSQVESELLHSSSFPSLSLHCSNNNNNNNKSIRTNTCLHETKPKKKLTGHDLLRSSSHKIVHTQSLPFLDIDHKYNSFTISAN
eukprot:TRINITY_DN1820_c0_g5_i1.p1 TRINITY_DN1820_c0_g5~~TRINITY_DN1820_c0_g5_i1.p1  ORF type:complete len:380 (-),score=66.64 TRINITY_DN1820_c0_g5_i1:136-1275(-)